MSIIKSFYAYDENGRQGDMFYIKHNSDSFTVIDCCMSEENKKKITDEIITQKQGKRIFRFISTHPDEDHICGLEYLDEKIGIVNFYCTENKAKKDDPSISFNCYCKLRDDDKKSFYVYKGCKRKWLNDSDSNEANDCGSSGIHFYWPDKTNDDFKYVQELAEKGMEHNNLSPIFTYAVENNIKVMWMGDIEQDFLEKVKEHISWPEVDILFAPHHGRDSGKVPEDVLKKLNPYIVVIGAAPSKHLNYYPGYNTIKQNSAGDIIFDCCDNKVHVYVSDGDYECDTSFLNDDSNVISDYGYYLGWFTPKGAK